MSSRPLVSVLLPCFDAEEALPASLDSLLGQTYGELEVIAVDDGSTDGTLRILEEFAARDDRVRVLGNEVNLGVIRSLNRAVAEARGELIARMDADDTAAPTRIERQVAILVQRPDIDVVGTGVDPVDSEGRSLRPRPVLCVGPGGARFAALFATPLMHPTIVARAALMRAHPYGGSPQSLHTEDYEMFTRMLADGAGFYNIDEPLMVVRSDPRSVSSRFEEIQIANFIVCAGRHLERTLQVRPAPGPHRVLVNRMGRAATSRDLRDGLRWLDRIERAFLVREPGSAAEIRDAADLQRVDILTQAARRGRLAVRLAAVGLAIRYGRRLLSARSRRYLVSKLGASRR
ncbi:MAG: glycosyltransferase family 2 protein [Mycobacteriales bacterium]